MSSVSVIAGLTQGLVCIVRLRIPLNLSRSHRLVTLNLSLVILQDIRSNSIRISPLKTGNIFLMSPTFTNVFDLQVSIFDLNRSFHMLD